MEDLLLAEDIKILQGHDVILCGDDPLVKKLKDWLDGSGLTVHVAKENAQLMDGQFSDHVWIFLPNDAVSAWTDAVDEFQKHSGRKVQVASLGGLNYAMIVAGGKLFADHNKHAFLEKLEKEKADAMVLANQYKRSIHLLDEDCEEVLNTNPVLVYGTTKVGTTSLYDSLCAIGVPARHLHAIFGEKISQTLLSHPQKVKILSGVREPLARDLSVFFQGQSGFDEYDTSYGDFDERLRSMMAIVFEGGKGFGLGSVCPYGMAFNWFDEQLYDKLGIDVFKQPFDKEKGFTIYQKGSVEVFLYRLENLGELEPEIQKFIGRSDFKLLHTNNAEKKNISFIYDAVKQRYSSSVPKGWVRLYYDDNERMDYFYTKEEQAAFLKKWNITKL